MKKNSKRKHRSEGDKYYIPFLPDEVFDNLPPELREIQREYRLYHRVVHDIKKRIKDNIELRKKLLDKIKEDKERLKERANDEYDDRGYEELMLKRFQKLTHLYEDYRFNVNISRVNRSSSSFKKNKDDMDKLGFINSLEGDYRRKTYGGKNLSELYTYHAQIKSKDFSYGRIKGLEEGRDKKVKTITLGTEDVMRRNLELIYDEDWSTDSLKDVREEWEILIRGFTNWFLTTKGWKTFKLETVSKEKLTEWLIRMGVNNPKGEFSKWIPKEG